VAPLVGARPHHNIQNGLTTNSRSYEFHSHQALLVRQFVENEPFLARNAFLCYTLYSSIPKDRIVEEFELPYPRVISTSTYRHYRVAVVDLKGKAGVQRTQSFAGVWGVPSFSTHNSPQGCRVRMLCYGIRRLLPTRIHFVMRLFICSFA